VADRPRTLAELDGALAGAAMLGLELDIRYRVLAVTLEPMDARDPWSDAASPATDRRVQLLVSPVSTILASLRRRAGQRTEVYTFTEEQLIDVAHRFDGAPVARPLFGRPEPPPGSWAPEWSLAGRSSAPDGTARTLTVSVRRDANGGDDDANDDHGGDDDDDDELAFDLFARFDEAQVKDPDGDDLLTLRDPDALGLDFG
jgi:hypothetical protein